MLDPLDAQLDARLREVPLPSGLVARLHEIATHDPSASDAELALFSDDALDQLLCETNVPAGLIQRVQSSLATFVRDEELDTELRSIRVPASFLASLQAIPWQGRRRQAARLATAAVWFLMVSVAYYGSVAAWLSYSRPPERETLAWLNIEESPWSARFAEAEPTFVTFAPDEPALLARVADADNPIAAADLIEVSTSRRPGPAGEVATQLAQGWQPWRDLLVLRYGVLGSPSDVSDRLPPLEALPTPRSAGLRPPLVRGYDREFLLKQGVHPIVSPDAHAELKSLRIPLTLRRDSFDHAQQLVSDARWPEATEIHTADFLAAMDYPLPAAAPGQVAVIASAGPSPFGAPLGNLAPQLLQVAVQAGPLVETNRAPVHLTVALDISASMNQGGRLRSAKAAVLQALDYLGPRDRLSLLLFNDKNQYEVLAASRDDVSSIRAVFARLQGAGGTNLAAALQRAATLAMGETDLSTPQRQLVLLTDGRAHLPAATLTRLGALLHDLQKQGLAWSVIDVSDETQADPQLLALTKQSGGKLHQAHDLTNCEWLLVEKMVGRSTIVAPDAKLEIVFDPRAVAAYRLIGHEPTRLAGLEPEHITLDLRAGQVATGLCELWLKPNAHDDVGRAIVTWNDPSSSEPRKVEQRISRLQFAPSFDEASLSLQAAAIAAETGEIFKQSPFAEQRQRGLQEVRALTARVHPRLAQRERFQQYLELIDAAQRVRGGR